MQQLLHTTALLHSLVPPAPSCHRVLPYTIVHHRVPPPFMPPCTIVPLCTTSAHCAHLRTYLQSSVIASLPCSTRLSRTSSAHRAPTATTFERPLRPPSPHCAYLERPLRPPSARCTIRIRASHCTVRDYAPFVLVHPSSLLVAPLKRGPPGTFR